MLGSSPNFMTVAEFVAADVDFYDALGQMLEEIPPPPASGEQLCALFHQQLKLYEFDSRNIRLIFPRHGSSEGCHDAWTRGLGSRYRPRHELAKPYQWNWLLLYQCTMYHARPSCSNGRCRSPGSSAIDAVVYREASLRLTALGETSTGHVDDVYFIDSRGLPHVNAQICAFDSLPLTKQLASECFDSSNSVSYGTGAGG